MSSGITEREAEVLAALGARLSNAQIAHRLHISVRTVESHVSSLLRKHGVADRTALAELAPGPAGTIVGLPATTTTFVGRDTEREAVRTALEESRLVALVGPGGVGKTRLAVVVAGGYPYGGAFVDLVPVRDGFVARAVAAALGVTEGSHQSLEAAVAARLGDGRFLLVLDNCEHVIAEAAAFTERLLRACPDLRVLVTSRERLGIPGERSVPVAPLPLESDAERLFGDRAVAADPGFVADRTVVADLCARLDGMPLAIELAAARSASLGAGGLLAALEDVLRLVSGGRGGDERHRSLRAVIGWSYDLLEGPEQALFRRLAAFAGSFDLDAACAIHDADRPTVADLLGRLTDKSLAVRLPGAISRWRLLDTVRTYALECLHAAGERPETQARHLAWAAHLAAALADRRGRREDRPDWREDFDAVVGDLRAALAGTPDAPDPVAHRLARALAHLTYARRYLMESFGHYRSAAVRATTPAAAAADLRAAAGCAHVSTNSNLHVYELLLAAAEQAHAAGDGDGRAIDLARAVETACRFPEAFDTEIPRVRLAGLLDTATAAGNADDPAVAAWLAIATAWLARTAKADPDPDLAQVALTAAEATTDPVLASAGRCAVATAALNAGRLREAHRLTRQRLDLLPLMDRDDPYYAPEICNTFGRACAYAILVGDLPAGLSAAYAGLDDDLLSRSHITASRLVPPLALTGRFHEAVEHAARMWAEWERAGRHTPQWMVPAVSTAALAYGLLGDAERYRLWRARASEIAGPGPAAIPFVDARLAIHTGDPTDALIDRSFAAGDLYAPYALAVTAELAVVARQPDAAERLEAAARVAEENEWAAACIARATGRLRTDPGALSEALATWERLDARFERACTLLLLPDRADEGHTELTALGVPLSGSDPLAR